MITIMSSFSTVAGPAVERGGWHKPGHEFKFRNGHRGAGVWYKVVHPRKLEIERMD